MNYTLTFRKKAFFEAETGYVQAYGHLDEAAKEIGEYKVEVER